MSSIVYLSTARLPTEKAHGFQVMKMCEGMAALGHEVVLMHPWRRQPDPALAGVDPFAYYGIERSFGIRTLPNWDVVPLERWLPGPAMRALFSAHQLAWGLYAARRAAQSGPDLVYARDAPVAYWTVRMGQPCVFEAHIAPSNKQRPLVRSLARRGAARAVVATASTTADGLEETGVPREKLAVVRNAADLTAFAAAPARQEARTKLGLPLERPIVGYVGRFTAVGHEKGIPDLIRAAAVSALRKLDPLLLCVGGPMDSVPGYEELARALGLPSSATRFVDRVPNTEVPTWLAALDVAAMPYPRDSAQTFVSPLKLYEYMAAGLPIVATDLPGMREVLDNGNAVLVPPGDAEGLGHALARLLSDPQAAAALAEKARRDAAENSWNRRAELALGVAFGGRG